MVSLQPARGGQQQHGSQVSQSPRRPARSWRRNTRPHPRRNTQPVALQLAEVERLFWSCDYVATTRGVDSAPVDVCSAATEELKNAKFGGDFMALLEWWRGNKPLEHARLARLTGRIRHVRANRGRHERPIARRYSRAACRSAIAGTRQSKGRYAEGERRSLY